MFFKKLATDGKGAAIAQWIRLGIPSCRPWFESPAHHPFIVQFRLYLSCEANKNKQKEAGIFKRNERTSVSNGRHGTVFY